MRKIIAATALAVLPPLAGCATAPTPAAAQTTENPMPAAEPAAAETAPATPPAIAQDHAALLASPDPRLAANKQLVYDMYRIVLQGGYAEWKAKGVPITDARVTGHGMREFEIRDPDGYWLWFGESSTDAPAVEEPGDGRAPS